MTEELVYDPKSKQLIKDAIYGHLYMPVKRNFQKRLDTLIQKNSELHRNKQRRLMYKTEIYEMDEAGPFNRPINQVHADLKPLMQEYIEDLQKLNNQELPYVLGFINQVLNSSNSIQDYFKVFPESLHGPIQKLIDQCGCRTEHLQPETVERLQNRNKIPIDLMKQRMVMNLLL
jgi:hypothetical protein